MGQAAVESGKKPYGVCNRNRYVPPATPDCLISFSFSTQNTSPGKPVLTAPEGVSTHGPPDIAPHCVALPQRSGVGGRVCEPPLLVFGSEAIYLFKRMRAYTTTHSSIRGGNSWTVSGDPNSPRRGPQFSLRIRAFLKRQSACSFELYYL